MPFLLLGVSVATFLLFRSLEIVRNGGAGVIILLGVPSLVLGVALAVFVLLLYVRMAPTAIYSDGIDAGSHYYLEVLAGRTFHSRKEFESMGVIAVKSMGELSKTIILYRRADKPAMKFSDRSYGQDFVETLERIARSVWDVQPARSGEHSEGSHN